MKSKKIRLKSNLHMIIEGTVSNKDANMYPELSEINNIIINNVNNFDKRFEHY